MDLEREMQAIQSIVSILTEFDENAQRRVLNYVLEATDLHAVARGGPGDQEAVASEVDQHDSNLSDLTDIRALREAKKPRTAPEMAALVAYYLAEMAPPGDRKSTITSADIEKYFKQAGHPLPSRSRDAFKTSGGFLEKTASGEYRLTLVGHNLITHKLPADKGKRS